MRAYLHLYWRTRRLCTMQELGWYIIKGCGLKLGFDCLLKLGNQQFEVKNYVSGINAFLSTKSFEMG